MSNLVAKMKAKIRLSVSFALLGATLFSKIKLFFLAFFVPSLHWRGIEKRTFTTVDILINGARSGITLRNYADLMTLKEIIINNEYEAVKDIENPSVIIDLGAHIGITSIYFASLFPGATVYAIEANPKNVTLLEQNTKEWDRIKVCNFAIADKEGVTTFYVHPTKTPSGSLRNREGGEPITVVAKTLQTMFSEYASGKNVDLLKFDVEGAEYEIFRNASKELQMVQNLIGEVHLDLIPVSKEQFLEFFHRFRIEERTISSDRFVMRAERI